MKKLLFFFTLCLAFFTINAQVPQSFKYQAIIRNSDQQIINNQNVGL